MVKFFLSMWLLLGFSGFMNASEIVLWVDTIEIKEETDLLGDQLYFYVLRENHQKKLSGAEMPTNPFSYTKSNLKYFQPARLWVETIADNEPITLNVSFLERELPPLVPDEFMGMMSILLNKTDSNELTVKWIAGDNIKFLGNDQKSISQVFEVTHDHGRYVLSMHLQVIV